MLYAISSNMNRNMIFLEYAMLHYDDICKIHEISQITKHIFNRGPPWF